MNQIIEQSLSALAISGNLRTLARSDLGEGIVDFTDNDYLGIAHRHDMLQDFLSALQTEDFQLSSVASRLLSSRQQVFTDFETALSQAYGKAALIFNSGYHANTGLIPAFADKGTTIIADKLVHASIIDGIRLAGIPFERFRHNDTAHLGRLMHKAIQQGQRPMIIVESIYSMDGDHAPLREIAAIRQAAPDALLYVDEAHAVGVEGPAGLGLVAAMPEKYRDAVDITVGTLGKAYASTGAYAILADTLRQWAINKSRSLIFSTALPPICVRWSSYVFRRSLTMDTERQTLRRNCRLIGEMLNTDGNSHIHTVMLGDPHRAVALSEALARHRFNVLPIRRPTVPPGTDRLRLSISARHTTEQITRLAQSITDEMSHLHSPAPNEATSGI